MVKPNRIPDPPPKPFTLKEVTAEARAKGKPKSENPAVEKDFETFRKNIQPCCLKRAKEGHCNWDYPISSDSDAFAARVHRWLKGDDVPYNIKESDVKVATLIASESESAYPKGTPLLRIFW